MKITINDPDGLLHAQLQELLGTGKSLHGLVRDLMHEINTNAQSRGYTNGVAWAKEAADAGEIRGTEKNMLYTFHGSRNDDSHGHAEEDDLDEDDILFLLSIRSKIEQSQLRADGVSQEKATPEEIEAWFQEGEALYNKNEYEEAVKYLRMAAENGNASAQFRLAFCHANRRGIYQDYDEAAKWYRMAAEQGHSAAIWNLGVLYENGQGVRQDYKQAAKLYRQSAELGDTFSLYHLGKNYLTGSRCVVKDEAEAFRLLRRAAELGHKEAMFQLGASYVSLDDDSRNCAEDRLEAGRWFLRAAMRGVTAAPIYDHVVSHCLNTALWNMTPDLLEDLRNCSAQGYVQASKYLSLCYKDGYGVERNEQEQFRYTQIAAEQGDSESQRIVAMASETKSKEKGKRKTKEEKEAEAAKKMELLFEAAEKGDIPAQYEIGCLYAKGRKGVKKNAEEAFKWYKKAADGHYDVAAHISVRGPIEAAHRKACYEVALCYENGICVEKDYKKAIGYYFYANEADLPDEAKAEVNYKVGHAYVTGDLGIRKPYSAAKYHLEIAAKLGHQQAKKELPGVRLKSMFKK